MASTTKGSIKISTANGIGAALVDVLGGEGYKPDEWEQNINICGIHAADIEDALENIEEDAGTGAERGSILLSTANAIGATLNKKFNTSRGFSPREWASAASKLEPLPERTASGAIANITDGADGVPLKNWLVTLPASLDGYTEVNGVQSKKNLFDYEAVQAFNANVIITRSDGDYTMQNNNSYAVGAFRGILFHLKPDTYSMSLGEAISVPIRIYKNGSWFNNGINAGNTSCTFTVTEEADYDFSCNVAANSSLTIKKCQFEVGSTPTQYTAYEAPTTYTASLGRTIYGGTADIVTGEGEATYKGFNLGALTWSGGIIGGQMWCWYVDLSAEGLKLPTNSEIFNGVCDNYSPIRYNGVSTNANTIALRNNGYLYVNNGSDTVQPAGKVTIALATPTDFTFTPITPTPETALGVNNFWADEGESAVTYRKDLDIPDPVPGNLLGMNNGNNEENEEESEG